MVPETRRRFLGCCAGTLAAAVAGCSGADDGSTSDEPSVPDEEDVLTDLETFTTRVDAGIPGGESLLRVETGDGSSQRPNGRFITDAEAAEALQFRQPPPDVDAVRTFLRETAYDSESITYHEFDVGGCREYALQYVELRTDYVSTQFCRVLRDPSVACSVDEEHRQVTFVRVPAVYDQRPSSYGHGQATSCTLPPDHPAGAGGEDA